MGDAFSFSPLSIPFLCVSAGLLVLGLLAAATRGNGAIRAALLAVSGAGLLWSGGASVTASCQDQAVATELLRFYIGAIPLSGTALLFLILGVAGRIERHLLLLTASVVSTVTAIALAWTTDLVIDRAWLTDWGLYYSHAGPLNALIAANLVAWPLAGVIVTRRSAATSRRRSQSRRVGFLLVIVVTGASDALLARGIGVYPFSFIPAGVAVAGLIHAVVRRDLLHARGLDRGGVFEIAALVVAGALVLLGLLLLPEDAGPAAAVAIAVPTFAAAQGAVLIARRHLASQRRQVGNAADRALEGFVEASESATGEAELGEALAELLVSHTSLPSTRLYVTDSDGRWQAADGDGMVAVDARVRAWLIANPDLVVVEDLPGRALGGLREPVQAFMALLDAEIVVPLVDREKLVGAITAVEPPGGRALRDEERELIRQAAGATARALTYLALFREAARRMEVAREVEVAAAVQHARNPGERHQSLGGCELVSFYQPAVQFGGDWWTAHELADGRLLVAIGDVTGHGVPAALISATVEGACETAQRMLGASFEVLSLLELLNRTVREVGGDDYSMSCFAALIDTDSGTVSFANAGHPFPYVVRRPAGGGQRAELKALVSRGTLLGSKQPYLTASSTRLEPDDVLVFYSDSLVDSRSPEREPFGERRLQRLLRTRLRPAGERGARLIMDEANAHYQGEPIVDDITLLVVRLGAGAPVAR